MAVYQKGNFKINSHENNSICLFLFVDLCSKLTSAISLSGGGEREWTTYFVVPWVWLYGRSMERGRGRTF